MSSSNGSSDGTDYKQARVQINLEKKGNTTEPQGFLEVIVTDSNGTPISGATVEISGNSDGKEHTAKTNDSARANFKGIPVQGYTVVANKSGYKSGTAMVAASDF